MWFTIFFGGSLMPGLTGILLNSMDDNMKEEGNSITQFCYNLLGYFPSPFLYGIICDFTGGNNSRWGLVFLMSFSVVGMYALKKGRDYQDEVDFAFRGGRVAVQLAESLFTRFDKCLCEQGRFKYSVCPE